MKTLFIIISLFIICNTSAQIITTFAGTGLAGNSGLGGPANVAQLDRPQGIVTDQFGNIYIADSRNNQIKKVNIAGIISVFAGTGIPGFSGDGGLATSAKLFHPYGISIDAFNNIYITDQEAEKLRKIDPGGIITTIIGTPPGFSGDGGPLALAQFNGFGPPEFDAAGNMYIGDGLNAVIRKVNSAGIVSTIAGIPGSAGFSGDGGPALNAQFFGIFNLVLDNVGNIYISTANRIRKIDQFGIINTLVGNAPPGYSGDGGPATLASVNAISGVTLDNAGNIFFADFVSHVIRKINTAGIISTVAGNGTDGYSGDGGLATAAQLGVINTITFDVANNLYLSIQNYPAIRKIANCPAAQVTQQPTNVYLCNSGNATFSTTATNLTGYQWQEKVGTTWNSIANNAIYAGTTTNTLNITGATTAMNNYQYRCMLANVCGNNFTNPATLSVTMPTIPTININTITNTICQGTSTTFTATSNNGGTTPIYQWKKNGINVGINANTYSNSSLINGDIISCTLTSNASCLSATTSNSNSILMTVNAPVSATISITASTNNICSGTTVNFNAIPTNGGISPIFQWKKNGINVGANTNTFNDNTIANGDVISCVLTSNQTCLISNTVSSNNITILVNPLIIPSISITANTNNVCLGTSITFNATTTNSGSNQVYQWKKNGLIVGTNTSTFTDNALTSTDNVYCNLSASGGCFTSPTVSSNIIQSNILQPILPTVSINVAKTFVCKGTINNFLSVATNTTATTNYQWVKNGLNVGTNASIYTDNNILNGDAIQLKITTINNNSCIAAVTVLSNIIGMTVFEDPLVILDHSSTICVGGNRTLDAGSFASYLWNDGSAQRQLNITGLGIYYVTVNDNNGCLGSDTTKVTALLSKPSNFLPKDTSICTYGSVVLVAKSGYKNYVWSDFSTQPMLTVTQTGLYKLTVTDNNNCKAEEAILVIKKDGCIKGFFIPTAFTPNNDNKNDFFKPLIFGNLKKYRFIIYNRYGQTLFETTDINKGWDGKSNEKISNTNGYIWVCNYQLQGEVEVVEKGTVLLVR